MKLTPLACSLVWFMAEGKSLEYTPIQTSLSLFLPWILSMWTVLYGHSVSLPLLVVGLVSRLALSQAWAILQLALSLVPRKSRVMGHVTLGYLRPRWLGFSADVLSLFLSLSLSLSFSISLSLYLSRFVCCSFSLSLSLSISVLALGDMCENYYNSRGNLRDPPSTTAQGKTTWQWPLLGSRKSWPARGPCNYNDDNDYSQRENEQYETTEERGDYHNRSHDYSHYDMSLCVWQWSMEEEERLTTTRDMTGQGEGTTTTTKLWRQPWLRSCRIDYNRGTEDERQLRRRLKESSDYWLISDATSHMVEVQRQ